MIVVDASAVIDVLLRVEGAEPVQRMLLNERESLHAPHLIDLEVAQVLRRYATAGEITTSRGREALRDLLDLPLARYGHDLLLPRIWELRHNLTAYDAAYVALAEVLDAPLLTRDARIRAARGHRAEVLVL